MTLRRSAALAAVLATAGAAGTGAAGCGRGGTGEAASATTAARTTTVERTTRVEVVKQLAGEGAKAGAFDPSGIYSRESPGVVTVISTGLQGGPAGGSESGLGSGFVISGDGEIATNAHVVTSGEGSAIRQASSVYVRFPDGNQVSAQIRGFDPFADVALLKVDPKGLSLRPLPLGSTKGVEVGAPVAAIGSPFGEEQSLSVGVVSATGRSIQSLTGFSTAGAIQTDAAINHGNSGGPLLDAGGNVLGINSQIRTESGDGSGVGFAVPVDVVRRSLAQLRNGGKVHYAYLGVSSRALYPQVAARFGLPVAKGVWLQDVTAGGPAARAGLRAGSDTQRFQEERWTTGGDIVVALNGHRVSKDDDLSELLLPHRPGDTITLEIYRGSQRRQVRVKLGERPLNVPRQG
jgi:S1-C subfamily serine protease